MRLIVGLGNPGIEYQFTPHNLGFLVVDRLANRAGVRVNHRQQQALTARIRVAGFEDAVMVAKPETYMNLSGMSVRALVEHCGLESPAGLLVIYDELDLPLGTLRIRERGSAAGHNGMQSIVNALGTDEIPRMRVGIAPERVVKDGARYLLSPFRKSQLQAVDELLERAADAVEMILAQGIHRAMNVFNQRARESEQEGPGSAPARAQ